MVAPRTVRCLCNRLWTHFSPRCLVFCKEGVRHRWRSEISWAPPENCKPWASPVSSFTTPWCPKWKLLNTVFPMVILTSIPENRKFQMSGSLHPCQPLKRWGGCSLAGLRTGHGWREISGVFPITKKIYQTKVYSKPLKRKVGNSNIYTETSLTTSWSHCLIGSFTRDGLTHARLFANKVRQSLMIGNHYCI